MKYDEERKPDLQIQGDICYVPQKPWIFNGTIRENILFYSDFDETRFLECIKYSCLERDLTILTNRDLTMIGLFIKFYMDFLRFNRRKRGKSEWRSKSSNKFSKSFIFE